MMRDGVRRFTIVLILRATTGDSLPCTIATDDLAQFGPLIERWLPIPKPLHPYPNLRFDAKYLR